MCHFQQHTTCAHTVPRLTCKNKEADCRKLKERHRFTSASLPAQLYVLNYKWIFKVTTFYSDTQVVTGTVSNKVCGICTTHLSILGMKCWHVYCVLLNRDGTGFIPELNDISLLNLQPQGRSCKNPCTHKNSSGGKDGSTNSRFLLNVLKF